MKMSDSVSRAGFNVRHIRHGNAGKRRSGTVGDRRRLLQESARHIDPKWTSKQVLRNGNVVAADTHLNAIFGRDDSGNWTEITTEEGLEGIVSYGTQRAENVYRKMTEKAYETTTIVSHLPKSLLTEVPGFYDNGRSRWVCDREVVENYANLLVEFLAENVLPEGMANVHGCAINLDETVPHVHVYADPFAPDGKHPGFLKSEAQKTWGQVNKTQAVEGEKRLLGKTKMKRYQADFRAFMIDNGVEIEKDADPVRSRVTLSKAEYAKSQETKREADKQKTLNDSFSRSLSHGRLALKKDQEQLQNDREKLAADTADLDRREQQSVANFNESVAKANAELRSKWEEVTNYDREVRSELISLSTQFDAEREGFKREKEEWYASRETEMQKRIEEAKSAAYGDAFDSAMQQANTYIETAVNDLVGNSQYGLVETARQMVYKDGTTTLDLIKKQMERNLFTASNAKRERYLNRNLTFNQHRQNVNNSFNEVRNRPDNISRFGSRTTQNDTPDTPSY